MRNQDQSYFKPIMGMIFGIGILTLMDGLAKSLGETVPVVQIIAVRGWFIAVMMGLWLPRVGGLEVFKTTRIKGHLFRVVVGGLAPLLFFTALTKMPLADVTVIVFCSPFIVTVLSIFIFGDYVGLRRWMAIFVGFAGVLIALQPTSEAFNPNSFYALGAAFSYAGLMVGGRLLSDTESTFKLVLFFNLGLAMIASAIVPFYWAPLGLEELLKLGAMGVFAILGHLGLTYGFNNAPAAVVSPFEYTSLVWATLLGFVFWGEFPGPAVVAGAAIIVASGLYSIYRETRMRGDLS